MKLLKKDEKSFTFLSGKRERDLFVALLLRYPVLSAAHFGRRNPVRRDPPEADDDLLREALSDQQKESRRTLEQWLNREGRFQEADLGYSFSLTAPEMEWMLQILNDIRVGSWVELGQPDEKSRNGPPLTEESMKAAVTLDLAGWFQHAFLQALDSVE